MPYAPQNVLSWAEIPVSDLGKATGFYNAVFDFGAEVMDDPASPNPSAMLAMNGVAAHLYPGTPAKDGSGPTLHITVDGALEDTAQRWRAAGGQVLCDPITIPPGRFVYCLDPDGNSIGLFEPAQAA